SEILLSRWLNRALGWDWFYSGLPAELSEEQIEVCLACLHEDSPVAHYRYSPVSPGVGPSLLRHPFHLAQLGEGACESVEQHSYTSDELGGHRCHVARHVHARQIVNELPVGSKFSSRNNARYLQKLIQTFRQI